MAYMAKSLRYELGVSEKISEKPGLLTCSMALDKAVDW
jgi:hypothetical protein